MYLSLNRKFSNTKDAGCCWQYFIFSGHHCGARALSRLALILCNAAACELTQRTSHMHIGVSHFGNTACMHLSVPQSSVKHFMKSLRRSGYTLVVVDRVVLSPHTLAQQQLTSYNY
jgi:hypothetical protein